MERSKASIRAEFDPIISAFFAAGGRVLKFNACGQRVA